VESIDFLKNAALTRHVLQEMIKHRAVRLGVINVWRNRVKEQVRFVGTRKEKVGEKELKAHTKQKWLQRLTLT
jgi:hypothetical protein